MRSVFAPPYVEVSDRAEEVRLLSFKCIFPSTVPCAAYPFCLKSFIFKNEILCLNTPKMSQVPDLLGSPSADRCHRQILKLGLSKAVGVSSSGLAVPPLAAVAARCSGARGCPARGPSGCGQGFVLPARYLQIPTRENFGCSFNATSPPFLSPFRHLAFFGK